MQLKRALNTPYGKTTELRPVNDVLVKVVVLGTSFFTTYDELIQRNQREAHVVHALRRDVLAGNVDVERSPIEAALGFKPFPSRQALKQARAAQKEQVRLDVAREQVARARRKEEARLKANLAKAGHAPRELEGDLRPLHAHGARNGASSPAEVFPGDTSVDAVQLLKANRELRANEDAEKPFWMRSENDASH
ncbi:hypothetical protein [Deinococcus yavapaiensis]|uniref:Uncharacterized protein n=1 Tax=Deinococcus yavapaiensis KR-236 TaxID=694435 RepID=A0A318S288_9DEIO|nr:hypothetical protein [Deinococcus yavapaiensis]PYE52036.1 hypothetical protein DES52_11382 [Deinococcus yavapaiensis KR-236]